MSKLINLYTDVLTSVGLVVGEDGYIKIPNGKKDSLVMVAKKPLVLPIKSQIDTMTETVDGVVEVTKTLFNPLKEDVVKGESDSLRKLKSNMEVKLCFSTGVIVDLLLHLGNDLDFQKEASLDLTSFIGTLKSVRVNNVTATIDDGTISRWNKIYPLSLKGASTKGLLHFFLKRGGVIGETTYNRLASTTFPMYKEFANMTGSKNSIFDVSLRGKDPKVFKLIFEYIFAGIDVPTKYMIGSNDNTSPGFISLYKMYALLGARINELADQLKFIDEEAASLAKIPLTVDLKLLDNIDMYAGELAVIPSDLDANRSNKRLLGNDAAAMPSTVSQAPIVKPDVRSLLSGAYNKPIRELAPVQPVAQVTAAQVDTTGMTAAQKILYGNTPQQAPMQQQMQQRPMGVNNQQPMMQQQMPMQQQYPQQQMQQQYPQQQMQQQYPQQQMQQRPMGVNNQQPMMQQQMPMQQQYPQQQMQMFNR